MPPDFEAIFQAALQLPLDQQHELLRRLCRQFAPSGELDEDSWRMIADRRAEYENGETSTVSWEQVKARLDAKK
jgi:putative addiction module component (TIGR02574 family)